MTATIRDTDNRTREKVEAYAHKWGFEHDGVLYFRTSWMPSGLRTKVMQEGIIESVGTIREAREKGIEISSDNRNFGRYIKGAICSQLFRMTEAGGSS